MAPPPLTMPLSPSSSSSSRRRTTTRTKPPQKSSLPGRLRALLVGLALAVLWEFAAVMTDDALGKREDALLLPEPLLQHNRHDNRKPPLNQSSNQSLNQTWNEPLNGHNTPRSLRRPRLILHVGPPKTATTTLQRGLAGHAMDLAQQDHWYYLGERLEGPLRVELNQTNATFTIFDPGRLHADDPGDFQQDLRKHAHLRHDVVVSSELFFSWYWLDPWQRHSTAFGKLARVFFGLPEEEAKQYYDTNANATSTSNPEPKFAFDVTVVTTYRHLFAWLPSMYYQSFVDWELDPPGMMGYVKSFLEKHAGYDPDQPTTASNNLYTTSGFRNYQTAGIERYLRPEGDPETSHPTIWQYVQFAARPELTGRVRVFDFHQQALVLGNRTTDDGEKNSRATTTEATTDKAASRTNNITNTTSNSRNLLADFVCDVLPNDKDLRSCAAFRHLPPAHARSSAKSGFLSVQDVSRIVRAVRAQLEQQDSHGSSGKNTTNTTKPAARTNQKIRDNMMERIRQVAKKNGGFGNDTQALEEEVVYVFRHNLRHKLERKIQAWFQNQNQTQLAASYRECLDQATQQRLGTVSWNYLYQLVLLTQDQQAKRTAAVSGSSKQHRPFDRKKKSSGTATPLLLSHDWTDDELNDNSWMAAARAAHDDAFEQSVAAGTYCQASLEKLLGNPAFAAHAYAAVQEWG